MLDALLAADWPSWLPWLAIGLALMLAAPLLLGPLLVKRSLKPLVAPEIEPDPTEPPADVRDHLAAATDAFARAGFKPLGRYLVRSELGGALARIALFRGPNGASLGYAAALPRPGGQLRYCEIGTSFEDGTSVTVGNSPLLGPFKQLPGSVSLQVPELAGAHALWDVHRAVVGARKAGQRAKRVGAGEEVAALGEAMGRSVAFQAISGYLRVEPGGRFYELTWRGAFRFTWLSAPPFGPLRTWSIRRRDAALMAELGARGAAA